MKCCCKVETCKKISFVYAVIHTVLGLSAALVIGIKFESYNVAMWAAISTFFSVGVAILHGSAICRHFRPDPDSIISQILPAILLVGVLGILFSFGVMVYAFAKAIANNESILDIKSHYILGIWTFLSLKWSFYLFQQARFYTRALDADDAGLLVINEQLPEQI